MLLQFSVTNHRSIKDAAIISMKTAADKTMKELLISPDGKKSLCRLYQFTAQMRQEKVM